MSLSKITRLCILCITALACIQSPLASADWLIVANGCNHAFDAIDKLSENRKILALDGASKLFKEHGMVPHVILGDFDSIEDKDFWGITGAFDEINDQTMPYAGNHNVLIVPAKDQDYTDLEKGILYCDSQNCDSIIIVNATGGRMDHTLANIGVLRKYYRMNRPLTIQTETEILEYVKDSMTSITGNIGDHCAIMGYPQAVMTTSGLTYNGIQYPLNLGVQESVCNTLAAPSALIEIQGEAIDIKPLIAP